MKSVRTRPHRKVRKDERACELPCRAPASTRSASRLEARPTRQKEAANQGDAMSRRSSNVMFVGRKQDPGALPLGHMAPERSGGGRQQPIGLRLQVGRRRALAQGHLRGAGEKARRLLTPRFYLNGLSGPSRPQRKHHLLQEGFADSPPFPLISLPVSAAPESGTLKARSKCRLLLDSTPGGPVSFCRVTEKGLNSDPGWPLCHLGQGFFPLSFRFLAGLPSTPWAGCGPQDRPQPQ
ncbi:hypothetical protein PAL_GLEAN10006036 [Pteropus alecto]|uniref:Uncharacterized protein n=1 Tax=Pteropus alecto TaxID=9402 RepID=L5L810_PTEAL|nr:hypothetical protein PAL_GLEAN10006036 [Pteropus alecto]